LIPAPVELEVSSHMTSVFQKSVTTAIAALLIAAAALPAQDQAW